MVLIQAAIPPGFEPATDDLEKLVVRRQMAKFTNDGKQLTFYVDRLGEVPRSDSFRTSAYRP